MARGRRLHIRNASFDLDGLRSLPSCLGWRQRVAGVPDWDGYMRFPKVTGDRIWTDEEINDGARQSLYMKAAGGYQPPMGTEFKNDPNDPPAVALQIKRDYRHNGDLVW